jgi:hypothetical protein
VSGTFPGVLALAVSGANLYARAFSTAGGSDAN